MTTQHSTIPAFKRALLARLKADAALSGVQVFRVDPFPDQPGNDQVVIGKATGTHASAAIGNYTREERYTVDVLARCQRSDQSSGADAEDAAYALIAIVEDSLRAWIAEGPPFGGIVRWGLTETIDDWAGIEAGSREGRVTLGIWVTARI